MPKSDSKILGKLRGLEGPSKMNKKRDYLTDLK